MEKTPKNRGRPKSANPMSGAERMRAYRKRKRAAGLKDLRRWVPDWEGEASEYSDHRILDARSLAMHCLIARKIAEDPTLIEKAKVNLARWGAKYEGRGPRYLQEWLAHLDRPWPDIAEFMTSMTNDATRLRSSSPFAGILSDEERQRVYAAFRP